jgi:hypothetical protein
VLSHKHAVVHSSLEDDVWKPYVAKAADFSSTCVATNKHLTAHVKLVVLAAIFSLSFPKLFLHCFFYCIPEIKGAGLV